MTRPRPKGKPVFDPNAINDDLAQLWPSPQSADPAGTAASVAKPEPAPTPSDASGPDRGEPASTARSRGPARPAAEPTPRPLRSVGEPKAVKANGQKRFRPPEALLSGEVYDALYQHQLAEKRARRALARPMGVIVLDAIERNAGRLQSAWAGGLEQVGEGALFERPSTNVVPPRRRHAVPPRNIVLSGVTPANSQRLDALVEQWGSGTRSALVEQALRYEFDLI